LRRRDPAFLIHFKREFRSLIDIRHPNLVELYELFSQGAFWFFTMELISGAHFLRYVRPSPKPPTGPGASCCELDRLRAASMQLADGIAALHAAELVHLDIKPSNVLVSSDGHVDLLDFGLARHAAVHEPQTIIAGTPGYMSPEQARGLPVGYASDWYSFGALLSEALTGSLPRATDPWYPGRGSGHGMHVPEDLTSLCESLLQVEPSRRPSGQEVIARLGGSTAVVGGYAEAAGRVHEPLIGRESQLKTLRHLLESTEHGRAVVVNLHGRSGIGKSTLIRTFCRQAESDTRNVVALVGRCYQSENVPFKALDDLVDGLSRYLQKLPQIEAEGWCLATRRT
jgi:serine/threonine protein kinase